MIKEDQPMPSEILERLLKEPITPASVGIAFRICDHPDEHVEQPTSVTYYCRFCGARAVRGLDDRSALKWIRPSAADLVRAIDVDAAMCLLRALEELRRGVLALEQKVRAGGDYAFATVDEVRDHQATLAEMAHSFVDIARQATLTVARRFAQAFEIIRAETGEAPRVSP